MCFVVSGPPQADKKEVKKIGRIGENVKIVYPIGGYPAPIIEWSKNGEKIDYMWDRHRTGKKSLKIKHVNADDTGIFTCKGKTFIFIKYAMPFPKFFVRTTINMMVFL